MALLGGFVLVFGKDSSTISNEMIQSNIVADDIWDETQAANFPIFRVRNKVDQLIELVSFDNTKDSVLVRYNISKIFEVLEKHLTPADVDYIYEKFSGRIAELQKDPKYASMSKTDAIHQVFKQATKSYGSGKTRWCNSDLLTTDLKPEAAEYCKYFQTFYEAIAEVRKAHEGEVEWLKADNETPVTNYNEWLGKGIGYNMEGVSNNNVAPDGEHYDEVMAEAKKMDEAFEFKGVGKPTMNIAGQAILFIQRFNINGREQYRVVSQAVNPGSIYKDMLSSAVHRSSLSKMLAKPTATDTLELKSDAVKPEKTEKTETPSPTSSVL